LADDALQLKIEEPSTEGDHEDVISDPEEDSLAGQMAALRGGPVKERRGDGEESDEESGTDDDEESESESSSSSDSD
jgi:translocation protein SEC63